jgi:large subunit ribosomal protein L6
MSRIGKKPITIPAGVEVKIEATEIIVKGPKGELKQKIHPLVKIEKKDNQILLNIVNPDEKKQKALWGLFGSLVKNMIEGVQHGYEKKLEVVGVGYRVALKGDKILLNLGFSHQVEFEVPKGITPVVEKNIISLSGIDKQLVGETAARIRRIKKPEPYLGKGIRYFGEIIKKKVGKAAKSAM